jgi:uncharacterized protein
VNVWWGYLSSVLFVSGFAAARMRQHQRALPAPANPALVNGLEANVRVTVLYALPDRVWEEVVEIGAGATLRAAIDASGVQGVFPALRVEETGAGVFGRLCQLDDPLQEGDRVEIYRPLQVDPKEARRIRAGVRRRAAARPGS